jgi:hypothetical protein
MIGLVALISSPIVLYIAMHILIIKKETTNNIAVSSLVMSSLSFISLILFKLINNCLTRKSSWCLNFNDSFVELFHFSLPLIGLGSFLASVILEILSLIFIIRNKDYKNAIYPILAFLISIAFVNYYYS